jgi:protoheme ferro-lyase
MMETENLSVDVGKQTSLMTVSQWYKNKGYISSIIQTISEHLTKGMYLTVT